MSAQTPVNDDRRARRVVAWVFAALGLLLLALVIARLLLPPEDTGVAGPVVTPSPSLSGSASPEPTPSPTDTGAATPDPSPSASSTDTTGGTGGTSSGDGTTDGGSGTGTGTASGKRFTMTATLVGGALRPGSPRTVRIVISNPNSSAIELQSVDVGVGSPANAGCDTDWVQVGSFRSGTDPRTVVAGHGTATISVPIELVNLATVNQDACKGATFPLDLSGTARQVSA